MGRKDEDHHKDRSAYTTEWSLASARYGVEIGRELFRRAVQGMPRDAVEREIEHQARPVIAWVLHKETRRLQNTHSFWTLSEAEQQRLLSDIEQSLERGYRERLEALARGRAHEQEAIAIRLANAEHGHFINERMLATGNAAAYHEIAKAAANQTRSARRHDRASS